MYDWGFGDGQKPKLPMKVIESPKEKSQTPSSQQKD
jgi:hypothetical protein